MAPTPKQKSTALFLAAFLAAFLGPLAYFYLGKWVKALLLWPILFIPVINVFLYFYLLFTIRDKVEAYNRKKFGSRFSV
ncbi:hypothetical protein J4419_04020 [Candidatus Woesearchaeota archaeon]|nr:hypothetical protein [Candidatus Woesearchaeota archaeon]